MGGSDGWGTGVVRGKASVGKGKVKGLVGGEAGERENSHLGKRPVLRESNSNSKLEY